MQNISKISASEVRGSGMHRKQSFKSFRFFKSDAAVQLLHFAFSFAFLAFAFLFFFAGHFLGIILVGKNFGKAFRIVG